MQSGPPPLPAADLDAELTMRCRRFLVVASVVSGLGGLLALPFALTSVFLFDAPGAASNPATVTLFFSALTAPLVFFGSIAAAWIAYGCSRFTLARRLVFLPVANVVIGGAALVFLELFNNGQFS